MAGQKNINRVNTVSEAFMKKDYKEIPVSVGTFLSDNEYLGNVTGQGQTIYPFWRNILSDIGIDDTRYLIVLTGAIGCLGPSVKVSLLDGRELTIPEIIEERKQGKQHWVYSYDIERDKVVPGKVVDAMLSGTQVDKIVEVELDNGEKIRCTHDHPFLLTSNQYRKAEELRAGDSLMPLYRQVGEKGYEFIGASKGQWRPTFRVVAEEIYGAIPKGNCVHHKWDEEKKAFDKSNNNPDMLKIMPSKKHRRFHGVMSPFKVIPGFASECAKKQHEEYWNGEDGEQHRKQAGDRLRKRNNEGQAKKASDSRWSKNVEEQKQKLSEVLTERNNAGQAKHASQVRWSKKGSGEHQRKKMKEWWATRKKSRETRTCALLDCNNTFECRVDSPRKHCSPKCGNKSRRKYNHKVVDVKHCSKKIDVYDLSIEKYRNFALTSGVFVHNTGKTTSAIAMICYGMYRILCLKSPWTFYEKNVAGKMAIVFFNLTKNLSASKGFNLLQSYLLASPWFRKRGFKAGTERNPRLEFPIFEYKSGSPYSKGYGFTGEDVIFAIMDEVDSETESEKQKIRVLQAYEAAVERLESRFVRVGTYSGKRETLGRFFLCASKQERLSFLNTFIVKMKNSPIIKIVDAALWEVKTDLNFSGQKFPIVLGDVYTPSKILGQETKEGFEIDQVGLKAANESDLKVLMVPIELLERFQRDLVGSLRRLAGVSTNQLRKTKLFPSEKLLVDCYDPHKKDPISALTIEVGLNDDVDLTKYINFSAIRVPKNRPRYIHVDIAYSGEGDALGLGMSCISGWSDRTVEDLQDGGSMRVEKLSIVETDFGMRIKARPGDKIPLNKIRKFIVDLKTVYGFNIKLVTYDYDALSEESKQILTRCGIECGSLSLDKSPEIYRNFRNLCGERRWCCHRNAYLHFELVNLEDDSDKNKVDHPAEVLDMEILGDGNTRDVVLKGSKDLADGVVGSVENALRDTEAPMPTEFVDKVKQILIRPKQVDTISPLLQCIERKSPAVVDEEDTKSDRPPGFKDIFSKSQRK